MKIRTKPSTTKAAILTGVFFVIWLVTNSNLPACGTEQGNLAQLNGGSCLASQSDLHVLSGWLALACLITGIVLFILKVSRRQPPGAEQVQRPYPGQPGYGEASQTRPDLTPRPGDLQSGRDPHQESFGDWYKGDNL
jgi:hypothetical protein